MNKEHIYIFFISISTLGLYGQQESTIDSFNQLELQSDTLEIQRGRVAYSIRAGIDISRPIITMTNDNFSGFEVVGDVQISEKVSVAVEIGNETKTIQSEQINFTSGGSFLKGGFDFKISQTIKGLNNQIFLGVRFGKSIHSQQVNHYIIWNKNRFWPEKEVTSSNAIKKYESLSANWLEIIGGVKTEVLPNIFMAFSIRLNHLLSDNVPDNFDNLFIPGFNKKTDNNKFGAGFNYTLSYALPIYFNKSSKQKKSKTNKD
ncbi:MAG: DUF6048 family protein [Flavobacteriaceae bacterium]|nr:DUF6048 family protein [Flavobacteriaceae bacterium]